MIRRKQWTSQSQYGILEAFMINFILRIFCYLEAMVTDRLCWKSTSKKNRPGINIAATPWFWCRFPDENLKVFQYHYSFLFPKICNIALQIHFLINKIYSVCVNAKRSLKWWIFENLQLVAWTEKRDFWSCVVHWSETAPCFLAVKSVGLWFNYLLRRGNQNTGV